MQPAASDKTFHLKWNNHLQNLSQLFTTIYSSAALADVTLSCRDGTIKAHKLVLSACSPYFEQIFKENPCKHPVIILKGIPYNEINLLVEFMYKGSVDVQELDLQSLMHTATELEIRGLGSETRKDASQLLNVNLEYPTFTSSTPTQAVPNAERSFPIQNTPQDATPKSASSYNSSFQTNLERLKQIHLYQQAMCRNTTITQNQAQTESFAAKRKRKMQEEAISPLGSNMKGILTNTNKAQKLKFTGTQMGENESFHKQEMEMDGIAESGSSDEEDSGQVAPKAKKHVTFGLPADKLARKKYSNNDVTELVISDVQGSIPSKKGGIKVVQLSDLQKQHHIDQDSKSASDSETDNLLVESGSRPVSLDEGHESDTSSSNQATDGETPLRPHKCDLCELRFNRMSHLNRHRLTHTGERPFICGGCGRSFARSDKLRLHMKICERDDPTVNMPDDQNHKEPSNPNQASMMSGMVRISHSERSQLMFTPGGDVMLAPKTSSSLHVASPAALNAASAANTSAASNTSLVSVASNSANSSLDMNILDVDGNPMKRGRGRPRKTPVPLEPKIKKKRGRPPKVSMDHWQDMKPQVSSSHSAAWGSVPTLTLPHTNTELMGCGAMSQSMSSAYQHAMKRKRGRPPKNYFTTPDGELGPKENYNATNLPFGDFAYLTEMMYNQPGLVEHYTQLQAGLHAASADANAAAAHSPLLHATATDRTAQDKRINQMAAQVLRHHKSIDLSDSSTDEKSDAEDNAEEKTDEAETENTKHTDRTREDALPHVMTVGDCQILKVTTDDAEVAESAASQTETPSTTDEAAALSVGAALSGEDIIITSVASMDDCTVPRATDSVDT